MASEVKEVASTAMNETEASAELGKAPKEAESGRGGGRPDEAKDDAKDDAATSGPTKPPDTKESKGKAKGKETDVEAGVGPSERTGAKGPPSGLVGRLRGFFQGKGGEGEGEEGNEYEHVAPQGGVGGGGGGGGEKNTDQRDREGRKFLAGRFAALHTPIPVHWRVIGWMQEGATADIFEIHRDAPVEANPANQAAAQAPVKETSIYGQVSADNNRTQSYVMKLARRGNADTHSHTILNELKVLSALLYSSSKLSADEAKAFPRIFDYGLLDESAGYSQWLYRQYRIREEKSKLPPLSPIPYVIMERLQVNLDELVAMAPLRRLGRRLSSTLAVACLNAVLALHKLGFIHRHITPRNFMIRGPPGLRIPSRDPDEDVHFVLDVVLIDYGAAELISASGDAGGGGGRGRGGRGGKEREKGEFEGSLKYASVNVQEWGEAGPVDDLWSVQYMVVEWELPYPKDLPWAGCKRVGGRRGAGGIKAAATEKPAQLYRGLPQALHHAHLVLQRLEAPDPGALLRRLYSAMRTQAASLPAPLWLPFNLDTVDFTGVA